MAIPLLAHKTASLIQTRGSAPTTPPLSPHYPPAISRWSVEPGGRSIPRVSPDNPRTIPRLSPDPPPSIPRLSPTIPRLSADHPPDYPPSILRLYPDTRKQTNKHENTYENMTRIRRISRGNDSGFITRIHLASPWQFHVKTIENSQ